MNLKFVLKTLGQLTSNKYSFELKLKLYLSGVEFLTKTHRYENVVLRSQCRTTNTERLATSMSQHKNYTVAPTLPQRWIVSLPHSVL